MFDGLQPCSALDFEYDERPPEQVLFHHNLGKDQSFKRSLTCLDTLFSVVLLVRFAIKGNKMQEEAQLAIDGDRIESQRSQTTPSS